MLPAPSSLRAAVVLAAALCAGCHRGPRVAAGVDSDIRIECTAEDGPRTPEGARLAGEVRATVTLAAGQATRDEAAVRDAVRRAVVDLLERRLAEGRDVAAARQALAEDARWLLAREGIVLVALDASGIDVGEGRRAELLPTTDVEILLVGLDGLDWDIADPLMAAGRMPRLAGLVERGTRARLGSITPLLSPVIWTSIATGREPADHGILDFLAVDSQGRPVPVTSNLRRTKAFWNVFSDAGVTTGVTAWWATWPAEPVDGFLVSDRVAYQLFQVDDSQLPPTSKVWPASLWGDVETAIVRPRDVPVEDVRAFLDMTVKPPPEPEDLRLVEQFAAVLAQARTHAGIGLKLHDAIRPRVGAYYFESTDTASHLFMRYAPPPLPEVDPVRQARFAPVVDRIYEHHDAILGTFLDRATDRTVVMVVSDHGFRSGKGRPSTDSRVETPTAAEWHEKFGVFVAAGGPIRSGAELAEASVLDIFPTMLALLGMPVAEDLDGRVLTEALTPEFLAAHPVRRVPTFETTGASETPRIAAASADDRAILESLVAIGYVAPAQVAPPAGDGRAEAPPPGDNPNARNNLGMILMNRGEVEAALAEFDAAVALLPGFAPVRVNRATALLRLGRMDEAQAALEQVLADDPSEARALPLLAGIHLEAGRTAEAERIARRATSRSPRSGPAWLALGQALDAGGRMEDARAAYRKAAEVDPDNPEPWNALGNSHEREGRYEEAASAYERATAADPTFAPGYNNLALQYQRLGRAEEALAVYEKGRARLPSSSILLNNLATWHHHAARAAHERAADLAVRGDAAGAARESAKAASEAAEAETLYRAAIAANPLDASPVNNLGALLGFRGDSKGELAQYEAAVRMDPRYADALYNIADWHARRQAWPAAHASLAKALAASPDHGASLRLDAAVLVQLGRPEEAVRLLEAAAARRAGDARVLVLLGSLHEDLGHRDEACGAYRKAVDGGAGPEIVARVAATCRPAAGRAGP